MSAVRRSLAVVSLCLSALSMSCNCDPTGGGGSFTCARSLDGLTRCYACPTQNGANICNTDGPVAGGCNETPITCP